MYLRSLFHGLNSVMNSVLHHYLDLPADNVCLTGSRHVILICVVAAQLIDLVARILALVPPWVRIYRIQRDIPMPLVSSGVEKGNLRELALARMGHLGLKCRDVRTREAGIQDIHHQARPLKTTRWLKPLHISLKFL